MHHITLTMHLASACFKINVNEWKRKNEKYETFKHGKYMLKECNTESLLHFPVFYYNWSILSLRESEEMNGAPLFCVCNCNNYKFLWDITVNKKYYQLGRDQTLTGENTQKTKICFALDISWDEINKIRVYFPSTHSN